MGKRADAALHEWGAPVKKEKWKGVDNGGRTGQKPAFCPGTQKRCCFAGKGPTVNATIQHEKKRLKSGEKKVEVVAPGKPSR